MISDIIHDIIQIVYDIMYDIIGILQNPNPHSMCCSSLAAANNPPAQRSDAGDGGNDPDREMDPDEARDYADQGPLPERDMEEDNEILATLLKHMPSCMNAYDIEKVQCIRLQLYQSGPCRKLWRLETCHHWMKMQPMSSHRANTFCRITLVSTMSTQQN
jgi:hypothetical protein